MRAHLLLTAAALLSAQTEAAPPRAPAAPKMIASEVNGEPVLRYGKDVITRPFGATLVDRLDVAGSYAMPGGRAFLVRGTAAGSCPVHYVVLQAQAGLPRPSAPFGTCSGGARVRVSRGALRITVPNAAAELPPATFAYAAGRVSPVIDPAQQVAIMTTGAAAGPALDAIDAWAGPGGCVSVSRAAALGASDGVLANFDRYYPSDWRRRGPLERVTLDPDQLRRVVTGLACLATWPAADPTVPKAALPIFASRKHGRAAFDLLEGVGRDAAVASDVRAAARAFHAEMRFRVQRREPI